MVDMKRSFFFFAVEILEGKVWVEMPALFFKKISLNSILFTLLSSLFTKYKTV